MVGQERNSDLFLVFQERYGRRPKTVTYPHTQHHTESLIQIAFSVEPNNPRKTPPFRVKKTFVCVCSFVVSQRGENAPIFNEKSPKVRIEF